MTDDDTWLRVGDDIIRFATPAAMLGRLENISLFRRDPQGRLVERMDAVAADALPMGIRLRDVVRRPVSAAEPVRLAQLDWPDAIDVQQVQLMARPPRELPLLVLSRIIGAEAYGMRPLDPYLTARHQRLAATLVPGLMLALAFTLARGFSRTGGLAPILITSVAIGFSFIIVSGVANALGEVGFLAPALAVWSPVLVLVTIILCLATLGRSGRARVLAPAIATA